MKLTILYDNEVYHGQEAHHIQEVSSSQRRYHYKEGLKAKWGFSCLLEVNDYKLLFDTGGNGIILLQNMEKMNIDPGQIDSIFISHSHWDHMGGLSDLLSINKGIDVFLPESSWVKGSLLPESYTDILKSGNIIPVSESQQIQENISSTGELAGIEQSLVVKTDRGIVVVVGCAHSGVDNIIKAAAEYGDIYALIGGLHGFSDFSLLKNIDLICPTHCTQYKDEIIYRYPDKCISGGISRVIEFN
ncbi:MAG: MBL fold metallo-hydrolase [Halanaerobiales bacterium]